MASIAYKKGYKYQLVKDYVHPITVPYPLHIDIEVPFIKISIEGMLTIQKGYAWDGASGVFDNGVMQASLVHDAGYQLCRFGVYGMNSTRIKKEAVEWYDGEYQRLGELGGCFKWTTHLRMKIHKKGLEIAHGKAASSAREVYYIYV